MLFLAVLRCFLFLCACQVGSAIVNVTRVVGCRPCSGTYYAYNINNVSALRTSAGVILSHWVDSIGDLYYFDYTAIDAIRKVTPKGIGFNVINAGQSASSGVVPISSVIISPYARGISGDPKHIYLAVVNRVWRGNFSNNMASLYVGTGTSGYSGDGGPASSAQITFVWGMWAMTNGALYLADQGANVIRYVSTGGIITSVAGNPAGTSGFAGDGTPATSTNVKLSGPRGVYADTNGIVFIADSANGRIRQVNTQGIIQTFAGGGSNTADGFLATSTSFSSIYDVQGDSLGTIYLFDFGTKKVRYIHPQTNLVTTLAIGGTNAQRMTLDYTKNLVYIAEYYFINSAPLPLIALTSAAPTASPTSVTAAPTAAPTTQSPSDSPTLAPAAASSSPSVSPSAAPTAAPSSATPSAMPSSVSPTAAPTTAPSTSTPSDVPTVAPTTSSPSAAPIGPTAGPTATPTCVPSTVVPTVISAAPTTATQSPSVIPTQAPVAGSLSPSASPSAAPSVMPSTLTPTATPTASPSVSPTESPTTGSPSVSPTGPTLSPTKSPTVVPSQVPTEAPTVKPTATPTTASPTKTPTAGPTVAPTTASAAPTLTPTNQVTEVLQLNVDYFFQLYSVSSVSQITNTSTGTMITGIAVVSNVVSENDVKIIDIQQSTVRRVLSTRHTTNNMGILAVVTAQSSYNLINYPKMTTTSLAANVKNRIQTWVGNGTMNHVIHELAITNNASQLLTANVTNVAVTSVTVVAPSSSSSSSSKVSVSLIVAVVIGGTVFLILLCSCFYYFFFAKRTEKMRVYIDR